MKRKNEKERKEKLCSGWRDNSNMPEKQILQIGSKAWSLPIHDPENTRWFPEFRWFWIYNWTKQKKIENTKHDLIVEAKLKNCCFLLSRMVDITSNHLSQNETFMDKIYVEHMLPKINQLLKMGKWGWEQCCRLNTVCTYMLCMQKAQALGSIPGTTRSNS